MRITNKIMQNNNLNNINTNKIYQDILSNQMSTQKKVNRPSDDPVVAIRALRLRGNVTEVTQYYSKNIPDAKSWLEVTEDALDNLTAVITDMISQATKGSNGDLTSADRQTIIEQLQALSDEVYSTGNADYAGRYVFTGYRTDTPLCFTKEENINYTITEQLSSENIDIVTSVTTMSASGDDFMDINAANYANNDVSLTDVKSVDVYRIRLAYNDLNAGYTPTISYIDPAQKDANGEYIPQTLTLTIVHDYENPYNRMAEMNKANPNTPAAIFIPETGEMLLSDAAYAVLKDTKDLPATSEVDEGEIRITYQKEDWANGTLRPEHYFACSHPDGDGGTIEYNASYLTRAVNEKNQVIEYDVGFNQTIQVNSMAEECFYHGIGREVNDLVSSMQEVVDMEAIIKELETAKSNASGAAAEALQKKLDIANKTYDYMKDKTQKLYEASITTFQGYLDSANLAVTSCGTRSGKLALIETRMQTQKTTFETLKSENEDADITEVAIKLSSAELTYEAALMATGKIMQTTLLNFI